MSPHTHRADVQGLRAVAVIMVILFHSAVPFPAGFAGVDVFLVISGFVITGQMQRLHARGEFRVGRFFARRVQRLFPALLVMLLVVLLFSLLIQPPLGPQETTAKTAAGAITLTGNFVILRWTGGYFANAAESNVLLHVWSLSVEEQFYLAFPFIMLAAWWLARRLRRPVGVPVACVAVVTGFSFALSLWTTNSDNRYGPIALSDFAFYSSPTRAWEFGVGALLALLPAERVRPGRQLGSCLGIVGAATLLGMNFVIDRNTPWPGTAALLPVLGTALVIAAGTGPVTSLLATRPVVRIGDLSYSLYLWHWPFILFGGLLWPNLPLIWFALLSVPAAWAGFRYVEQPIRGLRIAVPAAFGAATLAGAGALAACFVVPLFGSSAVTVSSDYAGERMVPTAGTTMECMVNGRSFEPSDVDRCMVRVPRPRGWIMLVGDSHANAISTGVVEAGKRLGYDVLPLTGAGCVFSREATSSAVPNCGDLNSSLLDRVTGDGRPSLVITTSWLTAHLDREGPSYATEVIEPALREVDEAGVPLLYVRDVPNLAPPHHTQISPCLGGLVGFRCSRSEADILHWQGEARTTEDAFRTALPSMVTFDPWDVFCRGGTCSTVVNGRLGYLDYEHLNGLGSAALADGLVGAVERAVSGRLGAGSRGWGGPGRARAERAQHRDTAGALRDATRRRDGSTRHGGGSTAPGLHPCSPVRWSGQRDA
ncbi:acyltransferase [Kineosporia sp. J2-2]|uniref:Acyltransferase n=1 Tax=Kineosporia corallincola TaxID=2835133 RepID=A0ABS5TH31_9ACTN|nr:acyltransferase family protein [Kineosporia corallincola]MBT0769481.1 acyltransferase [Kineosporia corallincola]